MSADFLREMDKRRYKGGIIRSIFIQKKHLEKFGYGNILATFKITVDCYDFDLSDIRINNISINDREWVNEGGKPVPLSFVFTGELPEELNITIAMHFMLDKKWIRHTWGRKIDLNECLLSFKEGEKYKVGDDVYEEKKDAFNALFTKGYKIEFPLGSERRKAWKTILEGDIRMQTNVPKEMMNTVFLNIPFTTADYVDMCLPSPEDRDKQNCVEGDLKQLDLAQVVKDAKNLNYKMSSLIPLIRNVIINHNYVDGDEGFEAVRAFFHYLDLVGDKAYGDAPLVPDYYKIVTEDLLVLCIEENNVQVMDYLLPTFQDEILPISDGMRNNGKMKQCVKIMTDRRNYEMIGIVIGVTQMWHTNLVDIRKDFDIEQIRALLMVPLQVEEMYQVNINNEINERMAWIPLPAANIHAFLPEERKKNQVYFMYMYVATSIENGIILKSWEKLIFGMMNGVDIKSRNYNNGNNHTRTDIFMTLILDILEKIIQNFGKKKVSEDCVRWMFHIVLYYESRYLFPKADNLFVAESVNRVFKIVIKGIFLSNDEKLVKRQKAEYYLKIWRQFGNIEYAIKGGDGAYMEHGTKLMYNTIMRDGGGENEFFEANEARPMPLQPNLRFH